MDAKRLGQLSRRHGGLFTRQDAARCGYNPRQIRRRVLSGEWTEVCGPVLAPSGLVLTPLLRDGAAQMALPGSVLAGPSAARRWSIEVSDQRTYLYVGANGRRPLPRVRQLRAMPDPLDVGKVGILAVTRRPQTVVDCLRLLPEQEAVKLLDRALLRRWISVDELVEKVHRGAGRPGAGRLARLTRHIAEGTRSAAERLTARLLTGAELGGWTANTPIHDEGGLVGLADFAFPARKLILEIDGWAFHQDPARFISDRERQNRLLQAGWTVLRFTWYDLRYRPMYVIDTIRAALR